MKLFRVGEKSRAVCQSCKQLRPTTFVERDVPLSSGKGTVPNVLVAVCDVCDRVVSVPQQSAPRIREVVHSSRHSIEARVPRHLMDALGLACHELGFGPNESAILFRFYLQRASRDRKLRERLGRLASSDEAKGRAGARFSAKLTDEFFELFRKLERATRLSPADLVKSLILQMKKDILDDKKKDVGEQLRELLLLAG